MRFLMFWNRNLKKWNWKNKWTIDDDVFQWFWIDFVCRNRKIRTRWCDNWFEIYWQSKYLTFWCCKKNKWFLRNKRNKWTNACWFLNEFECEFWCENSKIKTFDKFSSMMLTYMLVKLVIEIEILRATLANRSNVCDWCNFRVLEIDFECCNRKIWTYCRNRLQKCFCIWCQIFWCRKKNKWFLRNKWNKRDVCWFLNDFVCKFWCENSKIQIFDRFSSMLFTYMFVKLVIEIEYLIATSTCRWFFRWFWFMRNKWRFFDFAYEIDCIDKKMKILDESINNFLNFFCFWISIEFFSFSHIDLFEKILKNEFSSSDFWIANFWRSDSNIWENKNNETKKHWFDSFFIDFDAIFDALNMKCESFDEMIVSKIIADSNIYFDVAAKISNFCEINETNKSMIVDFFIVLYVKLTALIEK